MKFLPLPLRFIIPLLAALLVAAYVSVPIVDQLSVRWFTRDLDMRSHLIASAMSDSVNAAVNEGQPQHLLELFNRIVRDERIVGVGICTGENQWAVRSNGFPAELSCNQLRLVADAHPPLIQLGHGVVHVASLSFDDNLHSQDRLVLLHDMSFIAQRSEATRKYLIVLFVVLGSAIALITMIVAQLSWRGWVAGVRALLSGEGLVKPFDMGTRELRPVASDLRAMIRELDDQRRFIPQANGDWTPARLRELLKTELRGDEVIVVSNREPYIHQREKDQIKVSRPASGLVTAVEPVMRACSGTWIAHGSGSADREVVDKHDTVAVPPNNPSYRLKRVWLSPEDEAGYYYGFANEGLWPLCHVAHVRPVFRESDWECYRYVNQRFADAVIEAARTDDPVVLVQDYHLALVPRMVRERLPRATIITFWHIPWPNPESFGICPWRAELVDGLLGSSILGFHTPYHCKHFLETVDRLLEARIEQEHSTVSYGGQESLVKHYPISIAWPDDATMQALPDIATCRHELRQRIGADDDHLVAIGVDRFDYTKGIIERVNAAALMLEQHPELIGRFSLVQIAAPTRSSLDEYRAFQTRLFELVNRTNERFGHSAYQPIHLFATHHDSDTLQRYYRAADLCVVTSLHDGMNLVAKEFVAVRDDERGVLLLSRFAGAANEMREALIVNPYHVEHTMEAMYRGLTMPEAEQRERMRSLRTVVQHNNVFRWAGDMLQDAAQVRLRERIEARVSSHSKGS